MHCELGGASLGKAWIPRAIDRAPGPAPLAEPRTGKTPTHHVRPERYWGLAQRAAIKDRNTDLAG